MSIFILKNQEAIVLYSVAVGSSRVFLIYQDNFSDTVIQLWAAIQILITYRNEGILFTTRAADYLTGYQGSASKSRSRNRVILSQSKSDTLSAHPRQEK